MTKRINPAEQLDPLIRDALAWVVRLKSGEATVTDAEQMVEWRTRSPAHERAFRDAVRVWRAIGHDKIHDRSVSRAPQRRKTGRTSHS